ncbi:polysaccharide deacetylase family protein [Actinomadura harenae]|uniref:Polysaccharide deacetylase n=1 Tax=Actinomadura harenae TaxID=2483351 RepID=A0A3M2LIT1_9ACTN|nr:polysaccharide deacetylase family protein [Actinomadura harenae]RMI37026.1 polysaccharide deacetylase [Actinomadura harenae]
MPLLHKIAGIVVVCALVAGLAFQDHWTRHAHHAATAGSQRKAPAGTAPASPPAVTPTETPTAPATGSPSATPGADVILAAVPAAVQAKANELGQVPVFMYHRIMKHPQASLDRSTRELYTELTRLARTGYYPITAAEFASGRLDVPLGRHPVVLTFDDSTPGQFSLDAQGNPAPDTAVAIIQQVARENPGFRPVATFYCNADLFALGPRAAEGLRWLIQNGFEVANHTVTHPDLRTLSKSGVQKEIAGMEDKLVSLTGRHTTTFAYPFGSIPHNRTWAQREDGKYSFQIVFLAGWKPSESPFDKVFDRWAATRIRSEGKIKENDCRTFCSTAWLDWLDAHPQERYTSDGDPGTVTFPKTFEKRLAKQYRPYAREY